jgi:hypothetical protein
MTTVTFSSTPDPHVALADLVYQHIIASPHPIYASLNLWNGLVSLIQQGANPQQLEEFLSRLATLLTPHSTSGASSHVRFEGRSAQRMLANVRQAMSASASAPSIEETLAGPNGFILAQINLAQRMLRGEEGRR